MRVTVLPETEAMSVCGASGGSLVAGGGGRVHVEDPLAGRRARARGVDRLHAAPIAPRRRIDREAGGRRRSTAATPRRRGPPAVPASSTYAGGAPVDGGRHWNVSRVPSVTAVGSSGGAGTSGGPTANDTSAVGTLVLVGPVVRTRAKYDPGGTGLESEVASAGRVKLATSLAPSRPPTSTRSPVHAGGPAGSVHDRLTWFPACRTVGAVGDGKAAG